MEIQGYFAAIRKRWKLVASAAVVGALVALGMSLATTPRYESSAQLFLSPPGPGTSREDDLFTRNRIPSYVALLKGDQLAQVVRDTTGVPLTADELAKQVRVTSTSDTFLIAISVTDVSPERARLLANAYAAEFTKLLTNLEAPLDGGPPAVRATLVQPAQLPSSPVVPTTYLNAGIGGLLGLLLGIGFALIWDHRDDTIEGDRSASEASDAPVLGTVAIEPGWSQNLHRDLSAAPLASAEALRRIRTNLESPNCYGPPHVVVLTGAVPGVDTTPLAANLARACATAGRSVALVDGDLTGQGPSLTTHLELDSSIGLTDVLSKSVSADQALKSLASYRGGGSFAVLGAGSPVYGSRELLFSEEMDSVLRSLQASHDLVFIDSPAVLKFSDAVKLAQMSGGAIVVARLWHTGRSELRAAAASLRDAGANVSGVILTSSPRRRPSRFRRRRTGMR
jgi:capsular polysaccharide biosynthesis protein/Mrp family chromosome partitioning ATPase